MKLLIVTSNEKNAAQHARTRAFSQALQLRGHDVSLIGPRTDLSEGVTHLGSDQQPGRVAGRESDSEWFDLVFEDLNLRPLRVAKWVKRRPVLVLPPDLFPPAEGAPRAPDYLFHGFLGRQRARCYVRAFFAVPDDDAQEAIAGVGIDRERIRVVGPTGTHATGLSTSAIPTPELREAEASAWRRIMEGVFGFMLEIIESHRAWH